jgi:hypothetical protein
MLEVIINKAVDEFDTVYSTIEGVRQTFIDSEEDVVVM